MVKQNRFDSLKLGTILGLIVPALGFVIFYLWSFSRVPFTFFIQHSIEISVMSKILSLNLLPNLVVFFLYLGKNYYLSARGILLSTMLWTAAVLVIKFVLE